jgi:integrase
MDLSLVFCLAMVADAVILRFIPARRRVARFVCMSIFFAVQTVLIVALIGSPLRPVYRPRDLPREFWLQILVCFWWALAARELISFLALPTAIRKTAIENKLLSDIIAASIYVCSALAMMGFVLGLSLQGLLATSGMDLGLRGGEIVELCLEDIDWRAGTLVVRDERLGANIKLQLDIVSFFDN